MNRYISIVHELGGKPFDEASIVTDQDTEQELQNLELILHTRLPIDYREFVQEFGGFFFYGVKFPLQSHRYMREGSVSYFYGVKSGSQTDLLTKYHEDLANMVIPSELLPIGRDAGGNQICLFVKGNHKNKVLFWVMDEAVAPCDGSNLYFIADTFDDFISMLQKTD